MFFLYDFNVSGRKEAEEQFVLSELTEYIQGSTGRSRLTGQYISIEDI